MKHPCDEPDFEAERITVIADSIRKDEKKFRRTGDHNTQECGRKEIQR